MDNMNERSMKSRMDEMKIRGMDAVESMKRKMSARTASMQHDVRSNPAKWAGIMTGAGIGLGLVGRYLRHRARVNRMPHLVIIEAC